MYSTYMYLEYNRGRGRFLYEAISYVPYKFTTVCYAETNERIYAWSMGLVELFSLFRERVRERVYRQV